MFSLTKRAQKELQIYLDSTHYSAVPFITWSNDNNSVYGEWIIGFIEPERISPEVREKCAFNIDQIEFIVDGPDQYLPILKGVTLDYLNNKFQFTKAD